MIEQTFFGLKLRIDNFIQVSNWSLMCIPFFCVAPSAQLFDPNYAMVTLCGAAECLNKGLYGRSEMVKVQGSLLCPQ
jgi:hypothetical protein